MATTTRGVRRGWTVLWKVGVFFGIWALLMAPLIVPVGPTLSAREASAPLQIRLYLDLVGVTTIVAATWALTRLIDRTPFVSVVFAPASLGPQALAGVAIGVVWLAVSVGGAWVAGWIATQPAARVSADALLGATSDVLLNVITQQLLLCGYVFQVIRREAGAGVAVGVSALLFVGYHAGAFREGWVPVVNVLLAGLLFCLAFLVAGTLWLPVFIHFAWNVLLGPVFGLTVSGSDRLRSGWQVVAVEGPALWTGGAFGIEGGLIVTLTTGVLVLAFAAAWFHRATRQTRGIGQHAR